MKGPRKALWRIAAANGGYFRSMQVDEAGLRRPLIRQLLVEGFIEQVTRGLYRIAEFPPHPTPDLAAVSLQVPKSVVCLISALSFHQITTQIPHQVDLAVLKGRHIPKLDYPPISVHQISESAFSPGIETDDLGGVKIRIYSIEKTLADCFKFRNQIGMDVAIEALKRYRETRKLNAEKLVKYAKVCRVMRVMEPYLESLL